MYKYTYTHIFVVQSLCEYTLTKLQHKLFYMCSVSLICPDTYTENPLNSELRKFAFWTGS